MPSSRQRRGQHASLLLKAVALLCVLLVVLVGAAQLLHVHPVSAPADGNCSLCVIAHLSASPAPVIAGPTLAESSTLRISPVPALAPIRNVAHAFRIRPPPSLTPHA